MHHQPTEKGSAIFWHRIHRKDSPGDETMTRKLNQEERESFIKKYLNLAYKIANRYSIPILKEDLRQIAIIGLIKAVDKFDSNRGDRFISFAIPFIRGEIQHYLRDRFIGIKVPRSLQGKIKVQSLDEMAFQENIFRPNQYSILETLPDTRQLDKEADFLVKDQLLTLFGKISKEQRDAISLVHLDGLTQIQAAKKLGVSNRTIHYRIVRGIALMRKTPIS